MRKIGGFWEFSAKIAGNNGSYTIFKKYVNSSGKTVEMIHDTYDKTHRFIHREIMNGQERLETWYNGTREWFSKWK